MKCQNSFLSGVCRGGIILTFRMEMDLREYGAYCFGCGHTVLVVVRQAYQVMSLTREASRLSDGYDRVSSGFDPIHFGPTLFKMQKRN